DSVISCESLVDVLAKRAEATLIELYPPPDRLVGRDGANEAYVTELVVPFIATTPLEDARPEARPVAGPAAILGRSEWLEPRVVGPDGAADRLLTELVAPAVRDLRLSGDADLWFFVRDDGHEPHLAVRLRGAAAELLTRFAGRMAGPLQAERSVVRVS